MKITNVNASILSCDLEKPFAHATRLISKRIMILVEILTNEGMQGIGEAAWYGGPPSITKFIIENELKEYLINEDPLDIGRIWDKMYWGTVNHGRKGAIIAAISGIDVALWDLKGKILDQPIYKLLGGYRSKIKAYASGGFYSPTEPLKNLIEQVEEDVKKGFKAIKIKVAKLGLEDDINRIEQVRKAIGNEIDLMVDANNGYKLYEAVKIGRLLDKLNVLWFEEPFPVDDIESLCELRNKIDTPISAGENEFTRYGYKNLILNRAVDIIQPDTTWCGGMSEAYNISIIASIHNMVCIPHSFSSIISIVSNLHLNCGIANSLMQEFDQEGKNPLRDELTNEKIVLDKDGKISVPEKPGLGITINKDIYDKYLIR